MALLAPDPHTLLDELVFRVGPAAAFPGRPAEFGQRGGSVFRLGDGGVVMAPPTSAAHALSRSALDLRGRAKRRDRSALLEFSIAVRSHLALPAQVVTACLAVLAVDALDSHGPANGGVRAEELVVASFEAHDLVAAPRR